MTTLAERFEELLTAVDTVFEIQTMLLEAIPDLSGHELWMTSYHIYYGTS